jgi:two-component system sensor histidine kinase BaeS
MASALYRMRLYQEAYGLTHLRFLTTAFIIWLAMIFVLFSATVLRGAPRWFTAGAVTAALAAVFLLAVVNPDARIVEANVQRARGGAEFDAGYLRELSADAVPAIVAALPSLPESGRCATAHWLVTRWGEEARAARPGDWRTWNYSRTNARRLVRQHEDRLRALACLPEAAARTVVSDAQTALSR